MNSENSVESLEGTIVQSVIEDQIVYFFVSHEKDSIQKMHLKGKFHEDEELCLIRKYVPENSLILDVGANVGNHAIFYEKFLNPREVIVVEPNPNAIKTLNINLALNHCNKINQNYLGIGLSDQAGKAKIAGVGKYRLGAARLLASEEGSIPVKTGDRLFWKLKVDFIKVDVEGLEIEVLQGMKLVIKESRPLIFIEVWDEHVDLFDQWMKEQNYVVLEKSRYHKVCENYLVSPREHFIFYKNMNEAG